MKLLLAVIGITLVAPGLAQRRVQQGQRCYTPENEIGQCFTLTYCPYIANVLNVYPRNLAVEYLRQAQRNCGNYNIRGDPVVCCDTSQQIQQTTTTPRNPFLPPTPGFFPGDPSTSPPLIVQTTPRTTTTTTTTTKRPTTVRTTKPTPRTTSAPSPDISDRSDGCRGPDLLYGSCVPLANCPTLLTRLQQNQNDATFANYLRASNSICNNEYAVVCCPADNQDQFKEGPVIAKNSNEIPRKLPTIEDGCGYSDTAFRKIVGGQTSKIGSWPWIALLGYDDSLSASPFKCGGALITARHVLTAAHCIRTDLTFVRLGEHDLTTDTETQHVDVPVTKVLRHPNYDKTDGHSDIAILYLDRNVQFTSRVAPICLPVSQTLRSQSYIAHNPFVAGWGRTQEGGTSASVLQELQIPVYENTVCVDLYRKQKRLLSTKQFDNAVICAGDLGGGKDTCQGDSGGPLMIPEKYKSGVRFYLIGVVSYGIGCARPEIPGVYTRVANFMDWIQKSVADT